MKKKDLEDLLIFATERSRQREARVDELLKSNGDLLERAREAETDRRLALELLGKCAKIMPGGLVRDDVIVFVDAKMSK